MVLGKFFSISFTFYSTINNRLCALSQVNCKSGYSPGGNAYCRNENHWTNLPSCGPNSCSGNPSIPNSQSLSCAGTAHNNRCSSISCKSGYSQSGSNPKCRFGEWKQVPTCTESRCANDPPIQNMNRHSTDCEDTESRRSCIVVCDTGFEATSQHATCKKGQWISTPQCTEKRCVAALNILNSNWHETNRRCVNTHGNFGECTVVCNSGYSASSRAQCYRGSVRSLSFFQLFFSVPHSRTHTHTHTQWRIRPTCKAQPCTNNPDVDNMNGASTSCAGTSSGSHCNVVCQNGYSASPNTRAQCMYSVLISIIQRK